MILALGARGREFDSRNAPFCSSPLETLALAQVAYLMTLPALLGWGGGAVGYRDGLVAPSNPERRLKRWLPWVESQDEHKIVLWRLLLRLSESMLASGAEQVRAVLVAQNQLLFCSGVPLGHNSSFLQGPAFALLALEKPYGVTASILQQNQNEFSVIACGKT
ncbi:hypothetical protein R1flu_017371 [Riccia fluitans]|uniref:Uncharacterized protein n=1 Tax=Riccia fluitans TaxID=41844 RepID=A0ABD1ZCX1_9MARC